MINGLIISAIVIVSVLTLMRIFRKPLRKWVNQLAIKYKLGSLRYAIRDADKNKEKTGRKNMVVFDTSAEQFDVVEKKTLKAIANARKNKNNAAQTEGRKWAERQKQNRGGRIITPDRVRNIEEKSLYVTR